MKESSQAMQSSRNLITRPYLHKNKGITLHSQPSYKYRTYSISIVSVSFFANKECNNYHLFHLPLKFLPLSDLLQHIREKNSSLTISQLHTPSQSRTDHTDSLTTRDGQINLLIISFHLTIHCPLSLNGNKTYESHKLSLQLTFRN